MQFNRVYQALAEHQVSDRWELRELLQELHRWVEILVLECTLEISDIALRVDRLHVRCLGHYRGGPNGFGLQGEIALNRRDLDGKEFWEILGHLLHQLLHAWQQVQGKSGKGCYHNVQFRRKAAEFGLLVDQAGHQQYQPKGPFMRLLKKHGVHVPKLPVVSPSPAGSSKYKLWTCQCVPPFRVRVARQGFRATCNCCGQEFFQPDGEQVGWAPTTAHKSAQKNNAQGGNGVGGSFVRKARRKVRKQQSVA